MKADSLFFNKATIIGVGLIGASFALALKENKICKTVTGYGRREENLKRAKDLGIIDDYSVDVLKACEGADLVVLATPAGMFKDIVVQIKDVLQKGTLVTDVGSVKGRLVQDLESLMPEGVVYVGSHPIAGSEQSGIDDARPDLFRNARCIVTPTGNTHRDSVDRVAAVWKGLGSRVHFMDPFKHDEVFASVSHFPHLIAYMLVNTVNAFDGGHIEYAGQGFRDTTRIAMSSPEMWRDISVLNKDNLVKLLRLFRDNLDIMENMLESGDAAGIEREFASARSSRMALMRP